MAPCCGDLICSSAKNSEKKGGGFQAKTYTPLEIRRGTSLVLFQFTVDAQRAIESLERPPETQSIIASTTRKVLLSFSENWSDLAILNVLRSRSFRPLIAIVAPSFEKTFLRVRGAS